MGHAGAREAGRAWGRPLLPAGLSYLWQWHYLPFSPLGLKFCYYWLTPITTDLPSLNTLTHTRTTQPTTRLVLETLHLCYSVLKILLKKTSSSDLSYSYPSTSIVILNQVVIPSLGYYNSVLIGVHPLPIISLFNASALLGSHHTHCSLLPVESNWTLRLKSEDCHIQPQPPLPT